MEGQGYGAIFMRISCVAKSEGPENSVVVVVVVLVGQEDRISG